MIVFGKVTLQHVYVLVYGENTLAAICCVICALGPELWGLPKNSSVRRALNPVSLDAAGAGPGH